MTTLAHYVRASRDVGIGHALITLWPRPECAEAYWHDKLVPEIIDFGGTPVATTLAGPCNIPAGNLIAGLVQARRGRKLPDPTDLPKALEMALKPLFAKKQSVFMLLDGIEHWDGERWRHDVAAFRAFLQANSHRLFVVFASSDREALHRIFHRERAPLFHEGLTLHLRDEGSLR